jgi:CRISPR-associated protein Cmr6
MTTEANLKLPESTRNAVANLAVDRRHPGLQLDKFSPPGNQKAQKAALDDVLKCKGDEALLNDLRARRCEPLTRASALSWSATTAGTLTLHLSRASALENAGICLHPLYGFVYLPSSGLKGMACAYAETVWLASKPEADREAARADFDRVFGRAPKGKDRGSAGSVIFHDAWPETLPKLIVDIVNNHHKKYYRGEDAPGDWENPEPSYFLAIPADVAFSFALSPRRAGADADLALARGWLNGALCHLGAGAKTAAGYGAFRLAGGQPPSPKQVVSDTSKWAEWSGTLELVTPAFLAGANQQAEDCDLRPATLRGLLRWWWRTMHAGHVDVDTLRALEAAVWGNTKAGSPVRIELEPISAPIPVQYAFKERSRPTKAFKDEHDLKEPPNNETTQGVFYASYGMDEMNRGRRLSRWFKPEGATWKVRLKARPSDYANELNIVEVKNLSADLLLQQAAASLWLLCHFGGVGSKSRKGFGSLNCIGETSQALFPNWNSSENPSRTTFKEVSAAFRRRCGLREDEEIEADTPTLDAIVELEVRTAWKDPWFALDQLGYATQAFAQLHKHRDCKIALGLPRKIHGPKDDGPITKKDGTPVQDPNTWQPPVWLGADHPKRGARQLMDMRDATPVHFHLDKSADGALLLRAAAFPSPYLPDGTTNQAILSELLDRLRKDLSARANETGSPSSTSAGARTAPAAQPSTQHNPARATALRFKKGEKVQLTENGEVLTVIVAEDVRIGHTNMKITYDDNEPGNVPVEACETLD